MTTMSAVPAPEPDDIARGLEELERYVADRAPAPVAAPAPAGPVDVDQDDQDGQEDAGLGDGLGDDVEPVDGVAPVDVDAEGETRRVRRLRAEVVEARRIAALQDDETPLLVDTDRVRRRRRAVAEAARLHQLAQDPRALAYRDQRVRRTVTTMVMAAAGIALAVSSIGVQASVAAALELGEGTPGWWAAFGVEPALSLPLLAAVGVQAYSAVRGRVVDRRSAEGKRLSRVEALLLGLTLLLNCWPALPGVADTFSVLTLVVHALGPVAAVTAVRVLPTVWELLAALPMPPGEVFAGPGSTGRASRATGPTSRADAAAGVVAGSPAVEAAVARARRLIASGQLPSAPSASRVQRELRCGTDVARAVRDVLADGGAR